MMMRSFLQQIEAWISKQGYQEQIKCINSGVVVAPSNRAEAWGNYLSLFLPEIAAAAYQIRPQGFTSLRQGLAGLSEFCTRTHLSALVDNSCLSLFDVEAKEALVDSLGGYNLWLQLYFDQRLSLAFKENPVELLSRSVKMIVGASPWQVAKLFCQFGFPIPCSVDSAASFARYAGLDEVSHGDWVKQLSLSGDMEQAALVDQQLDLLFGHQNPMGLPSLCEPSPLCPSCFLQGGCDYFATKYHQNPQGVLENQLLSGQTQEIDSRQLILYLTGEKWQNRPLQNHWIEEFSKGNVLGQVPRSVVSKEDKDFHLYMLALEVAGGRLYQANHNHAGEMISSAQDIFKHYRYTLGREKHECFYISILDNKHHQVSFQKISQGILDQTLVHPREVFAPALHLQAAAIILIHNHPSGDVAPSSQDLSVTKRLVEAGTLLGIKVLDHVIISESHYFSFAEQTLMS